MGLVKQSSEPSVGDAIRLGNTLTVTAGSGLSRAASLVMAVPPLALSPSRWGAVILPLTSRCAFLNHRTLLAITPLHSLPLL